MQKNGFSNEKYLHTQSEHIRQRISQFGGKLYLEFGGKLYDDYHASRVLPGFQPDSKLRMLLQLKEQVEVIIAINAADIEKNKIRGDLGITYDVDVLRLIDAFRSMGLYVGSVVITQLCRARRRPMRSRSSWRRWASRCYRHYPIEGYPSNISHIVSDEGYGRNEYIETTRDAGRCHRSRPGQRQDGHLPLPALPRAQARHQGRLRQVRDLPDLEPAAQPPGQPGL